MFTLMGLIFMISKRRSQYSLFPVFLFLMAIFLDVFVQGVLLYYALW